MCVNLFMCFSVFLKLCSVKVDVVWGECEFEEALSV